VRVKAGAAAREAGEEVCAVAAKVTLASRSARSKRGVFMSAE